MDLTEAQWAILEPVLPKPRLLTDRRGSPWRDPRDVLNGILWILRTGAPWNDLPARYPSPRACHRRFQAWRDDGTLEAVLRARAQDLEARGELDLSECFIDATYAGAKKGAPASAPPAGGKGPRSWQWQTALVFLSPYPSQVLHRMKSPGTARTTPIPWMRDCARNEASSSSHHTAVPGATSRKMGRPLRGYRRRWKVERLFAWLHNFRRLITRYERDAENFLAFVQLGCIMILLRAFVR